MSSQTLRPRRSTSTKTKEQCTWCDSNLTETYLLPAAKKVFCSQSCLKLYRDVYSKGACPNCDNPIRIPIKSESTDSKSFCSIVCLEAYEKNNRKGNEKSPTVDKPQLDDQPSSSIHFKDWDSYLTETNSEAAPAFCFKQHLEPPENKFEVDLKLEARDDRNPTSISLATVIDKTGPRIKLRLDGGDSSDDFWRLVDSKEIFVYGTTYKKNENLQPPFGSRMSLNSYKSWIKKRLSGATLAPAHIFKDEPTTPRMNYFKVGQKIEAVDPYRPNHIAVATINRVSGDDIQLSFDGNSKSNGITCKYYSRDIFPAGWCEKSDHPLYYRRKIVTNNKNIKMEPTLSTALNNDIASSDLTMTSVSSKITLIEADTTKSDNTSSTCTPPNLDHEPSPSSTSIDVDKQLVPTSILQRALTHVVKKNDGKILITEKKAATSTTSTEVIPKLPSNPSEWTTENVISYMSYCDPLLGIHADIFKSHEIDGKALLLLNSDTMMKYMGLKLGPALKICNVVAKIKSKRHLLA